MQRLFAIPLRRHESELFQSVAFRLFRGAADSDDAVFLIGEKFSLGKVVFDEIFRREFVFVEGMEAMSYAISLDFRFVRRGDDLPARLAESIHRGDQFHRLRMIQGSRRHALTIEVLSFEGGESDEFEPRLSSPFVFPNRAAGVYAPRRIEKTRPGKKFSFPRIEDAAAHNDPDSEKVVHIHAGILFFKTFQRFLVEIVFLHVLVIGKRLADLYDLVDIAADESALYAQGTELLEAAAHPHIPVSRREQSRQQRLFIHVVLPFAEIFVFIQSEHIFDSFLGRRIRKTDFVSRIPCFPILQ